MERKAQRKIGLALMTLSVVALAFAVPEMVQRIRAHAADAEPPRWQAEVFNRAEFTHRGRDFSLTTEKTPDGPRVLVRYGEERESLYTQGLDDDRLPGLARHLNWLKIIALSRSDALASPEAAIEEQLAQGPDASELTDAWRVAVVARRPTTLRDPDEWKAVKAKDWKEWTYTFLELTDDGVERADIVYTDLEPDGWRRFAAGIVTPGVHKDDARRLSVLSYPNYEGVNSVIGAMGWTWAGVGVGAMVFVIGAVFLLLSFGSKQHVERVIREREGSTASDTHGAA